MAEYGEAVRDAGDQRQEFLESRQTGLGATDSAKILGLSRWGTALTVFNEKRDPAGRDEMSLPAWMGLRLQATVGELYATATGNRLRADNRHHRHPDHNWMVTHLDFRVRGKPDLLVECKTKAYMTGWGEDGTTDIPADVWVQVQHEMAVTGATLAHVAVLFGHHTFRVYPIPRDDEFIERLIPRLSDFWHLNVLAGVPPAPSGHDADTAAMKARYPESGGAMKAATPEHEEVVRELKLAVLNEKQAELAAEEIRNRIRDIIGEADGLLCSIATITWKKSRDSESTDWEAVAQTYERVADELFSIVNPGDDPELVARLGRAQAVFRNALSLFTVPKPGSRRFLVTFTKENV